MAGMAENSSRRRAVCGKSERKLSQKRPVGELPCRGSLLSIGSENGLIIANMPPVTSRLWGSKGLSGEERSIWPSYR